MQHGRCRLGGAVAPVSQRLDTPVSLSAGIGRTAVRLVDVAIKAPIEAKCILT